MVDSGFRSGNPPPVSMTVYQWIGSGLVVCFYAAGAVYGGCVERRGKLLLKRAEIFVTMIATAAVLLFCRVHGGTL